MYLLLQFAKTRFYGLRVLLGAFLPLRLFTNIIEAHNKALVSPRLTCDGIVKRTVDVLFEKDFALAPMPAKANILAQ